MLSNLPPANPNHDVVDHQPDWFELQVLAATARHPGFFNRVKGTLCVHPRDPKRKQEDFSYPPDNTIYELVRKYRTVMAGRPGADIMPPGFVQATLNVMVATGDLLPEQRDLAWQRVQQVIAQPAETVLPLLEDGMERWIIKQRVHRVAQQMAADKASWSPEDHLREIALAQEAGRLAKQKNYTHSFGEGRMNKELDIRRIQSGLTQLDAKIGGGFGEKEHSLFIAGTGGGKTVMACQLAATFALNGEPGIFISTEQGHEELEPRIYSNLCSIPFNLIKDGVKEDKLPEDKLKLVEELDRQLAAKLTFLDWKDDRSKSVMQDLENEVLRFTETKGFPPKWMIFDWIGGGLGQLSVKDLALVRQIYQLTADKMAQIADTHNMVTISFAQAATAKAKNNAKIDSDCMAECKSMGRAAVNIIGISALTDNTDEQEGVNAPPMYRDKQFFYVSKARKGEGAMIPFRREFAFQRIRNWT